MNFSDHSRYLQHSTTNGQHILNVSRWFSAFNVHISTPWRKTTEPFCIGSEKIPAPRIQILDFISGFQFSFTGISKYLNWGNFFFCYGSVTNNMHAISSGFSLEISEQISFICKHFYSSFLMLIICRISTSVEVILVQDIIRYQSIYFNSNLYI